MVLQSSFLDNQGGLVHHLPKRIPSESPKLFSFKHSYSRLDALKVTVPSSHTRKRFLQARSYWLHDAIDDEIPEEPALRGNHFWTWHWAPFHGQSGVAVSTGPLVEELT